MKRVIAMTACALSLTVSGLALADPPAPEGTPLQLRPAQAPVAPAPGKSLWKVGVFGLVGVGAYWLWKKKRAAVTVDRKGIRVLERTAVGVRSELVVVTVDGRRLLLGVTPSSIRTLEVLGEGAEEMERDTAHDAEPAPQAFLAQLRTASDVRPPPPRMVREPEPRDDADRAERDDVHAAVRASLETQTRGLVRSRRA